MAVKVISVEKRLTTQDPSITGHVNCKRVVSSMCNGLILERFTVKPVLRGHSKIDKSKVLKTNST